MSPALILSCIGAYFVILLGIAWVTGRNAGRSAYYLGNKASPWYVVAFGLIGDSLSGVTFISVPGSVGTQKFSYLQVVLGYMVGYVVIGAVLLPLYYRLNLTSIYGYLRGRFGAISQRTGAAFFLLSRLLGAAARLFLAATVVQTFVFDAWGVPFWMSVTGIIALILLYTYRGGIKTLVWTDTFQSTFLLLGVILSIAIMMNRMGLDLGGVVETLRRSPHTETFFFSDWRSPDYFWKQFLSGIFIAVVMTGLDQNSMQKNLSCPNLRDAQKNLYWFGVIVVVVNALFLGLGVLLYAYSDSQGLPVPKQTDQLFPGLALQKLGPWAAIVFVIGLTAATFSSADSVLTTLTTSFCIDILGWNAAEGSERKDETRWRHLIHVGFAILLLLVILGFRWWNNQAVISIVLKLATYTYGPLLGLFAFGLLSRRRVVDHWVPAICIAAPLVCLLLERRSENWLGGYRFGFELLMVNGLLTALMLIPISRRPEASRVGSSA